MEISKLIIIAFIIIFATQHLLHQIEVAIKTKHSCLSLLNNKSKETPINLLEPRSDGTYTTDSQERVLSLDRSR